MQHVELEDGATAPSVLPADGAARGPQDGDPSDPALREGPPGTQEPAAELVEDGAPAPDRTRPRWSRRRTVTVAGVAVAGLGLALVAGLVVQQAREDARADSIAAVPGLVRPLDGAPGTGWSAPVASTTTQPVLVSGDTLVALDDAGEEWRLTGYAVQDGTPRWSARLADVVTAPTTAGVESVAGVSVRCPSDGGDVGPLVVCVVTGPDARAWFGRSEVVAVDAVDGTEVGRWPVEGRLLGVGRVEDDVVVVHADVRGAEHVTRHDPRDGRVLWSQFSGDMLSTSPDPATVEISATERFVLVTGTASAALAASDGTELVPTPPFSAIRLAAVGDHLGSWSTVGGGWWHDATGRRVFALPALPARVAADDRSLDDVLVVDAGARLQGVDVRSGQLRWSLDETLDAVAVVDGAVVVSGERRFGVLDPEVGAMRWTVDSQGPLPWQPVSDGGLVLAPGTTADGRPAMLALGLHDGVRYWSVPLPEGVVDVEGVAGHLVVRTADEVVVLT